MPPAEQPAIDADRGRRPIPQHLFINGEDIVDCRRVKMLGRQAIIDRDYGACSEPPPADQFDPSGLAWRRSAFLWHGANLRQGRSIVPGDIVAIYNRPRWRRWGQVYGMPLELRGNEMAILPAHISLFSEAGRLHKLDLNRTALLHSIRPMNEEQVLIRAKSPRNDRN